MEFLNPIQIEKEKDPSIIRAAVYTRVSKPEQKLDMQINEISEFATRMRWDTVFYTESESSVKTRPMFNQLMKDAKQRKFDVVLVYKIDRFARSVQQLKNVLEELDSMGIRFISITQGVDTNNKSPMGRLVISMLGMIAEFERDIIIERVNSGLQEYRKAYAKGKIGKDKDRHSRSKKDLPVGRPHVIVDKYKILELRGQGLTIREIGIQLGVDKMTIFRKLKENGI